MFFFVCAVFLQNACADDFYSLWMDIEPVDEITMENMAGENAVLPENDKVLVFGRMDHPGFYVESLRNIAVESSNGSRVPVMIDLSSVLREFDGIVALLLVFNMPEDDSERYRIVWGASVEEPDNTLLDNLQLDSGLPGLYRQFRWKETLASDTEETPFSTIVVIADSTAEYHFLWYLLPIGLVFILLTVRRFFARDPSA